MYKKKIGRCQFFAFHNEWNAIKLEISMLLFGRQKAITDTPVEKIAGYKLIFLKEFL